MTSLPPPITNKTTGSIFLIAGCCIGAGMLGIPVVSAVPGFFPASCMFLLIWLFMAATGLLLLEITLWFENEVHIVSIAGSILGRAGKASAWLLFLFLFYSLMVAYIAASGSLLSGFLSYSLNLDLPPFGGSVLFTCLFTGLIYSGIQAIDRCNRILMAALLLFYFLLVGVGLPHTHTELLLHHDWSSCLVVIPVLIVSFGFHNLVPSLTGYLDRDPKALRKAILIGSAIPLAIYLIWQMVILGLVPAEQFILAIDHGDMVTELLQKNVQMPWIPTIASSFAFFAIVTSLLSVSLSFVDFLGDALSIRKTPSGKIFLATLVLAPPLFFSWAFPSIFLTALNYAGGYGAVALFGILPVLIGWKGRYQKKKGHPQLLGGGKPVLILLFLVACFIIALQTRELLNSF